MKGKQEGFIHRLPLLKGCISFGQLSAKCKTAWKVGEQGRAFLASRRTLQSLFFKTFGIGEYEARLEMGAMTLILLQLVLELPAHQPGQLYCDSDPNF